MSPYIAQIIIIISLVLSIIGILFWLTYITLKNKSPYDFSKENKIFFLYNLVICSTIFLIYDFTPVDSSDLKKIEQHLDLAKRENNKDLVTTIQEIKNQPIITIKDKKYIDKLMEKGI
jgi:hypothetical protein